MKQLSGNLTMLCMALWLGLSQTHFASAQEVEASSKAESKSVPWASSLVSVRASAGTVMTGIVVKAESDTALVLTTFQQLSNAEPYFSPNGKEMTVSIKAKDGELHEIKGAVTGVFGQITSTSGVFWHTIFVEVKHNGLKLTAVPIAENVPGKDAALAVVGRHCPDSFPSANLQNAKLVSEIDPAMSHDLLGQLSGTSFMQESLLTVHDQEGALVGIGSQPFNGGMGGGGFGGGGGMFSLPDPLSNGFSEIERQPISFISVVDRAESLRQMGVPVSDAAIELQEQRRRIHTDAFGRPIQGENLQITWSDDHKELHGFSTTRGEWTKLSIKEQDVIIPIVGKNVGAVSLDGKIAAYSPEVGQWDVMTLRPGSQMPPSISSDIVTVRDGKDYYTFAASSGIWTSPTNSDYQKHSATLPVNSATDFKRLQQEMRATNNRAIVQSQGRKTVTISGPRHHVVKAERMMKDIQDGLSVKNSSPGIAAQENPSGGVTDLNSPLLGMKARIPGFNANGPGPGIVGGTVGHLELQSLDLAKRLRARTDHSADEKAQLLKLVSKSLDQKLQQQRMAAKRLREKLESVEKALQSREANRKRIIERRVEELLDPSIDWATVQPNSSSVDIPGMPVTGIPIGLPGPSHIAIGSPGPDHIAVGSSAEKSKSYGSVDRDVPKLLDSLKKARAYAVEMHAPRITEMKLKLAELQQSIETLQKTRGKNFTAAKQQEAIQTTRDYLKTFTAQFRKAFTTWELTWRQYEAQLEAERLDVEDAQTRIELTQDKFNTAKEGMKEGFVSAIEVKELETQFKLQKTELRRALNALEAIERISKDFPELNPASCDTSELLDDEQTAVSLNSEPVADVVLLNFRADYCKPCREIAPILRRMEEDKFPIRNIDITEQGDITKEYKIGRIPTLILLIDGREAQRFVGLTTENELRLAMNRAVQQN